MKLGLLLVSSMVLVFTGCKGPSQKDVDTYCQDLNALTVQKNVSRLNLMNKSVTRTQEGGPFKPLVVKSCNAEGCQVVASDRKPLQAMQKGHPDANKDGIVLVPNVNPTEEQFKLEKLERALAYLLENQPGRNFIMSDKAQGCFKKYPVLDSEYNFRKMSFR